MKKHKDIDNPYALAWYEKNKGDKSHYKANGTKKESMKPVTEKWGTEMHTAEKDKGMWKGWSQDELKAKRNSLRDKENKTDAESKKLRQVNFALRAKHHFGKVPN